jgi:hypothetical protein
MVVVGVVILGNSATADMPILTDDRRVKAGKADVRTWLLLKPWTTTVLMMVENEATNNKKEYTRIFEIYRCCVVEIDEEGDSFSMVAHVPTRKRQKSVLQNVVRVGWRAKFESCVTG